MFPTLRISLTLSSRYDFPFPLPFYIHADLIDGHRASKSLCLTEQPECPIHRSDFPAELFHTKPSSADRSTGRDRL